MMKKYERLNRAKKSQLHPKQWNELSKLLKDEGTFTIDAKSVCTILLLMSVSYYAAIPS